MQLINESYDGIISKYKEKNFFLPKGTEISDTTMSIVLHSDLVIKNSMLAQDLVLEGNWRYSQSAMTQYAKKKELYITRDLYLRRIVNETRYKTLKDWLPRVGDDSDVSYNAPIDLNNLNRSGWGSNEDADEELRLIFGVQKILDYPKPTRLIEKLLASYRNTKDCVCLDFFSGSATTANAVMQLNAKDGGHRKCILVTNNENNICEEVTYERNKRVIQGYTTPKGEEVEGLHDNNLRYYRTNFLSRDKSVKNMRQLVRLATDMLCIKNDVYTEAEFCGKNINPNIARYFDNGQGNRMLVIYEERAISLLVQLMAQTEDDGIKTMVYVFSPGADPYTDDFEDVAERVNLCALPSAIYEAYKRVLPKRKPKFLDEALQEMKTQAEAEANVQQTLDFGENDNMNEEGGEA